MTPLDIRGSGTSWRIVQGSTTVAGPYSSHCNAISAMRGVEQRLNPAIARHRRCRCGETFLAARGEVTCTSCKGKRHG